MIKSIYYLVCQDEKEWSFFVVFKFCFFFLRKLQFLIREKVFILLGISSFSNWLFTDISRYWMILFSSYLGKYRLFLPSVLTIGAGSTWNSILFSDLFLLIVLNRHFGGNPNFYICLYCYVIFGCVQAYHDPWDRDQIGIVSRCPSFSFIQQAEWTSG